MSCSQYYTVAVGKVNPAKLANLMEIDIYVLVACPECSLLQSQVTIASIVYLVLHEGYGKLRVCPYFNNQLIMIHIASTVCS